MDRFEALKAMNHQVTTQVAACALDGIDLKIAMIAVWGVHHERFEQALARCHSRGVMLTEAELYELAAHYRLEWRIDESRETRKHCFLCDRTLPEHIERLCQCFRAAEAGVYICDGHDQEGQPYITLQMIESLRKRNPRNWESLIVETICCVRCKNTDPIPAGVVAATLRRREPWHFQSRKFCHNCYQDNRKGNSVRTAPLAQRVVAPKSTPRLQMPEQRDNIGEIQTLVANLPLPVVGES